MRRLLSWLVILVVIAGALVYFLPGPALKLVLERGGSSLAETNVDIDRLDFSWNEDRSGATIDRLTVANPSGFTDAMALSFDQIDVNVDRTRTNFDTIALKEMRVERPVIVYELGLGSNNIETLKKTVERKAGGPGSSEGGFAPRYVIDRLVITEGELLVQLAGGKLASTKLPAIDMKDIGAGTEGVTASELGRIVMTQINANVATAAATRVIRDALGDALGNTGGKIGDVIDDIFR